MSRRGIMVEMPVGMFYGREIMTIFRIGERYEVSYGTLPNATMSQQTADNDDHNDQCQD